MQPSEHQQRIIEEIINPTKQHQRIEAVAGSGKTTTIELAMQQLPDLSRAQYMAFNKRNVEDIMTRMGQHDERVEVATFNATGFRTLRRELPYHINVDAKKTNKMLLDIPGVPDDSYIRNCINRTVSLCKATLVMPEHDLAEIYDLLNYMGMIVDEDETVVKCASAILKNNLAFTEQKKTVDFDDQLYLPICLDLPFYKKTHLFVDECQDTNAINFEMMKRMLTNNGRCFMVGDSHQAIYGFRGANDGAMEIMANYFNAGELPLPITYRCDKAIVALAQTYVPQIQARPDADLGLVEEAEHLSLKTLEPKDLILCRLNSPLMGIAWKCLRQQIPFNLLGKELQPRLERLIKKVSKGDDLLSCDSLEQMLYDYLDKEREKLQAKKAYGLIHALEDEVNCLEFLCTVAGNVEELKEILDKIFKSNYGIKLSTVHKAKGAEAPHVVIIDADKLMPLPKAKTLVEIKQEDNIIYVAITRAKHQLTYVNSSDVT